MDNSIGNGNDTFFLNKNPKNNNSSLTNINNTNNTKMTDVSKEFGELNKEIYNKLQEKSQDHSNFSYNKNDPNNNSVGNLLDEYWTDKITSPDTSEHFALKIENFNKISKHKPKVLKEKSAKPAKMILNIPNSKFKKNSNAENTNSNNNFNVNTINNDQKINEVNKTQNPNITINNNKILVEIPNKVNTNNNQSLNIKKNGIIESQITNTNSELDDDTNEGIPAEYSGLVNMPYTSIKNNDLKDINTRCMRLNTDDNAYGINEHFYSNMKVSPIKDPSIKHNNNNINNFGYRHPNLEDDQFFLAKNNINKPNPFMINPLMPPNMHMNNMGHMMTNITNQTNNLCLNGKYLEKNNLSTGLSTNESNESFDSNQNKFNNNNFYEERSYTPGHPNISNHQFNLTNKKIDFNSMNLPMNAFGINRVPGPNPIHFPINFPINNVNSRNKISDENRSLSYCKGPEYYMNPYAHNTINFIPPNNAFYDNIFSQNNIDNNLFSYNLENKVNQEKKRNRKPEEFDGSNLINLDDIIQGKNLKTTIMIRHIPNKYTPPSILEEINQNFRGKYDFFYMPIDHNNDCNLGYAFINFIDPLYIIYFFKVFKSRKWKRYKSPKQCDMAYGKFQGINEIMSNLENSNSDKPSRIPEDKKPLIFMPPNPLPKIEIPIAYQELFRKFQANKLNRVTFIEC